MEKEFILQLLSDIKKETANLSMPENSHNSITNIINHYKQVTVQFYKNKENSD